MEFVEDGRLLRNVEDPVGAIEVIAAALYDEGCAEVGACATVDEGAIVAAVSRIAAVHVAEKVRDGDRYLAVEQFDVEAA